MKFNGFLLASLILAVPPTMAQSQRSTDWRGIQGAFTAYVEYPSGANAKKVVSLLPNGEHIQYTNEKSEAEATEFVYQKLNMLERQVISRDPDAVELAFRLKTIADGAFAEDLDIVLGQLIRIDPRLFLQQLKIALSGIGRLDALVGNYGDVYVDKFAAQRLETDRRTDALESVSDPALQAIRDECIGELRKIRLQLNAASEKRQLTP